MTNEQATKVMKLKEECVIFHEQVSTKIDDLCNSLDFGFREASRLSHIADRLDLFVKELSEF